MDFIALFLLLIVPGFIAALVSNIIYPTSINVIFSGLIFDLLIFILMITGLYYFKGIATLTELSVYLDCMSFSRKYALLSTAIGILLGLIFGFVAKLFFWIPFFRRR